MGYTINLTGSMALPEVFDLNGEGVLSPSPRATTSESFSIHNFQMSRDFGRHFGLYIGLRNVTNFRQKKSPLVGYNDPNVPVGFSEFFDTSYAYAPIHGREFYLGFKWNLDR